MFTKSLGTLALFGMAGSAFGGSPVDGGEPARMEASSGAVHHAAHIYFNVATGEKITTLIQDGDVQGAADGEEGTEIWIATTGAQCADFGDTTFGFYKLDDPEDPSRLHNIFFDWGDIAMDTVVDCVQIHWITNHQDVDLVDKNGDPNPDGHADGVEGFAGTWTYWDGMTGIGVEFDCIASPLISIQFHNLPGALSDSDDSSIALYTADIDLGTVGDLEGSLVFEIGDSDSDLQGAAVHNVLISNIFYYEAGIPGATFGDPDADGLADWGWSVLFDQPGTVDVDNADGDNNRSTGIDGDPLAVSTAGVMFGSPTPGHPEYDAGLDTWSWISDGPTAGITEDLFTTAHFDSITSSIVMDGPFNFGGFSCPLPDDPESEYVPAVHFQIVLYGPGGGECCSPDLNCDGEIDFFDISFFLSNEVDYDGSTGFDFFDISAFLGEFSAGCP